MTKAHAPQHLRELGVRESLLELAADRREADAAEARLLARVVHLVDLLPSDDLGCAAEEQTTASGRPVVAERLAEEIGAVLGISYRSALRLVGDAVEICYRLPRLWSLVHDGRLRPHLARRVADHTRALDDRAAVDFVDAQVAVLATRGRVPSQAKSADLVAVALERHDPDTLEAIEDSALSQREVQFDHQASTGTSRLYAVLDTADALDLDSSVSDLACTLGRLGDPGDLGVRRAHALGMLADPQRVLHLYAGGDADTDASRRGREARVFMHVSLADLATRAFTSGVLGTEETLGRLATTCWSTCSSAAPASSCGLCCTSTPRAQMPSRWMAIHRPSGCGRP